MIPTSVADEIIQAYGNADANRRADPGRAACCDLLLEGVALLEGAAAELKRLEVTLAAASGGEGFRHQGATALEVMDRTGRRLACLGNAFLAAAPSASQGISETTVALQAPAVSVPRRLTYGRASLLATRVLGRARPERGNRRG
jgi:hypothetical protein